MITYYFYEKMTDSTTFYDYLEKKLEGEIRKLHPCIDDLSSITNLKFGCNQYIFKEKYILKQTFNECRKRDGLVLILCSDEFMVSRLGKYIYKIDSRCFIPESDILPRSKRGTIDCCHIPKLELPILVDKIKQDERFKSERTLRKFEKVEEQMVARMLFYYERDIKRCRDYASTKKIFLGTIGTMNLLPLSDIVPSLTIILDCDAMSNDWRARCIKLCEMPNIAQSRKICISKSRDSTNMIPYLDVKLDDFIPFIRFQHYYPMPMNEYKHINEFDTLKGMLEFAAGDIENVLIYCVNEATATELTQKLKGTRLNRYIIEYLSPSNINNADYHRLLIKRAAYMPPIRMQNIVYICVQGTLPEQVIFQWRTNLIYYGWMPHDEECVEGYSHIGINLLCNLHINYIY